MTDNRLGAMEFEAAYATAAAFAVYSAALTAGRRRLASKPRPATNPHTAIMPARVPRMPSDSERPAPRLAVSNRGGKTHTLANRNG